MIDQCARKHVVLIGVGEMGGIFARGFLKAGYPVYPVTRGDNMLEAAKVLPNPESVIVAVAEKDLDVVLETVPAEWEESLVLLQNELLPANWQKHHLSNPTVISVWFEKKPGKDVKVIIPSPVYGSKAGLVQKALQSIKIPCRVLEDADQLLFELILKNLYILTTNICGLKTGGNVGDLWSKHQGLARDVANDVLDLQFHLAERQFDRDKLIAGMVEAFNGDPLHQCMGRSAPARLKRAVDLAAGAGIDVLALRGISSVCTASIWK